MTEPIKVILVDDHRLFRDGLRLLLSADRRFRVAGEAANGEEFLRFLDGDEDEDGAGAGADGSLPLVFMDIDMPGMGGVEATHRALERCPELKVIALSMHGEQEFYLPMVEAGAKGFLLKDSDFEQVAAAAEKVAAGGTFFSSELVPSLVEAMQRGGEAGGTGGAGGAGGTGGAGEVEPLSERETEVLPLVCEGLSNLQIAQRLFISKRTVDKHRANILAKTGCRNTASLVLYAVKHNMITI